VEEGIIPIIVLTKDIRLRQPSHRFALHASSELAGASGAVFFATGIPASNVLLETGTRARLKIDELRACLDLTASFFSCSPRSV